MKKETVLILGSSSFSGASMVNFLIDKTNYSLAVEIASLPNMIRGYGYVRRKSIEKTNILRDNLMEEFVKEK